MNQRTMTSHYPDGSTHPQWDQPRVVIPQRTRLGTIDPHHVESIVCHRHNAYTAEEYLVRWKTKAPSSNSATPHSWHNLQELSKCLLYVQQYIATLPPQALYKTSLKRKTPSDQEEEEEENSTRSIISISSSSERSTPSKASESHSEYHGTVRRADGNVTIIPSENGAESVVETLPTVKMVRRAGGFSTQQAQYAIRTEYRKRLARIPGPPISLENNVDDSTPMLDFQFVSDLVPGKDVEMTDEAFVLGCGSNDDPQGCRPHMGQYMGCEYSRKCQCLEFAAVDKPRLTPEEKVKLANNDLMGLPKRFPYYNPNSRFRPNCLVGFYLDERHVIYECNPRCNCGPECKTRLVQRGRTIPLEVFKTGQRGWGIRTLVDVNEGQFIDTYRGEIITADEADDREAEADGNKASYLYTLDKYVPDDLALEDCYVVDGEHMGGPTRFMNHSCDPNCGQYTVSYNKYDVRIYQLAFFAKEDIEKGTELTFDYLDKDDVEDDKTGESQRKEGDDPMVCRCGAPKCRRRLWM
ncbi:MAG: hypothetical protein M1828_002987 [Chrysothrix sp. TS-e1954]|nr:MAG: hypothetical protein M1828_002987 [Chrysothrix sp. TS-e1954]